MSISIFADGANIEKIADMAEKGGVDGFTTNPTLMRREGVSNYALWARSVLEAARGLPVSFEVVADDLPEIERQARVIASWGPSAWVKVPVTLTSGESTNPVLRALSLDMIPINVTAVFTVGQIRRLGDSLRHSLPQGPLGEVVVSVFAGRVADAGRDPLTHMAECRAVLRDVCQRAQLLWASPRQIYDLVLAQEAECDIITMTSDLLAKRRLLGRELDVYSLETVEMFYRDAVAAGYSL